MAISYAGIQLCTPITDDLAEAIRDRVSLTDLAYNYGSLYVPSLYTSDFHWPGIRKNRPINLGTLYWPTDCTRYAIAHFLATDNELTAIRQTFTSRFTSQPLTLTWIDAAAGGALVDSVTASNMYMLSAQPLFQIPGLPQPLRQLYLITLVDQRWFFQTVSTGNLSVTDQVTTWAQLYAYLGALFGITTYFTVDPVNGAYQNVPGQFGAPYENAALFMDGTTYSVGQRFVCNPTNNACRAISSGNSLLLNASNVSKPSARTILSGGKYLAADILFNLPANLQIIFPEDTALYATTAPFSPIGSGIQWMRHHSANYTVVNGLQIQAIANQLAKDLLVWNTPIYDCTWNGIVNFVPEGLHDIEWTHRANRVSTRLTPSPYFDFFIPIVLEDVKCVYNQLVATYNNNSAK